MLKIKSNASGPDGISGHIYRKYADILASPLTTIINASFQQNTVPSAWKRANITPIPKGKGKSEFRPISLLPFGSKVLEIAFLYKIFFPLAAQVFNSNQFAFVPRKHQGTCNALTIFRLSILNEIPKCAYINCVAIDFLKAFDKISHNVILQAASNFFQLQTGHLQWLKSFLSDRKQRIQTPSCISEWQLCTSGVPQGSILGPTLFAMVMNSFNVLYSNSRLILYADDLTILHFVSDSHTDKTQDELDNLSNWSSRNNLFVNTQKCAILTVSKNNHYNPAFYVNGEQIAVVKKIKLLGVLFSSSLSMSLHGDYIIKKCSMGMAALNKLHKSGINGAALWRAYLGLVFSHISYCWPAVADLSSTYLNRFEIFEKRASKLAGLSYTPNSCHLRLNNICKKLMSKVKSSSDHPLRLCFQTQPNIQMNLRQKASIVPFNKSTRLLKSFARFYH